MQCVFRPVEIPYLCIGVFTQIEDLVLLVTPHHIDGGFQCSSLFLLHQQRAVGTSEQACCTGNHFKGISCRLFACVVNDENTDTMPVRKLLESADDVIIAGIAVSFTADLTDFLHCINDDELSVVVLTDKEVKLLIKPISDFVCRRCKV